MQKNNSITQERRRRIRTKKRDMTIIYFLHTAHSSCLAADKIYILLPPFSFFATILL